MTRPIVIIDDSEVVIMKLWNYIEKLDCPKIYIFKNGKVAIKECKIFYSKNKSPVVLLDMELPDLESDIIALSLRTMIFYQLYL